MQQQLPRVGAFRQAMSAALLLATASQIGVSHAAATADPPMTKTAAVAAATSKTGTQYKADADMQGFSTRLPPWEASRSKR